MKDNQKAYRFVSVLSNEHKRTKNDADQPLSLKYVPFIIKRVSYFRKKHSNFYSLDELLAAVYPDVVLAESRYDPTKSNFSTFLRYYLDSAINAYVNTTKTSFGKLHKDLFSFIKEYSSTKGVYPTKEEMLDVLKIDDKVLGKLLQDLNGPTVVPFNDEIEHDDGESDDYDSIIKIINSFDKTTSAILHSIIVDENTMAQTARRVKMPSGATRKIYDNALPILQDKLRDEGY